MGTGKKERGNGGMCAGSRVVACVRDEKRGGREDEKMCVPAQKMSANLKPSFKEITRFKGHASLGRAVVFGILPTRRTDYDISPARSAGEMS